MEKRSRFWRDRWHRNYRLKNAKNAREFILSGFSIPYCSARIPPKDIPQILTGSENCLQYSEKAIYTISKQFHQTTVMITHNEEIAQMADRTIRVEDGKIVSGGVNYAR